ncbi:MAG: tRNA (N6-isopentenyl adenosine(37)-C2)-methylthiotransferase MiaB [Deltaproteobacteria bacterium]|jgi:tRNA-2-methylthio-N6-dimethylallyladenosine synthase|nr:tRNA (N6-isopentenyl adenosine(37)-C2)-methylthiotransferase MiaB [Deltaproteobacteria bacterium]
MKTRNLYIVTYGCQMNVYDSTCLEASMRKRGWNLAESQEGADFIFLNTCSIREKAARRVIGHLKRLKALKLKNPALILGVGGCVAEQEGRKLLDEVPWLNLVVGPGRLSEIPLLVENLTSDMPPIVLSGQAPLAQPEPPAQPGPALDSGQRDLSDFEEIDPRPAPIGSFLTIMTGCDNYCAYCVVPYLRGPERSRPREEVLAEARNLVSRGSVELTLLGQNVNSYGRAGHRGGEDFVDLLTEVSKIPNLLRLRFTTSHPKDFPPALVGLFGKLPSLCEHLHLPLQAGSDRILAAMGRRYDKNRYLSLVSALREACPDLALSTDVIVGFPGETEEEFLQTVDLLETVRFDFIFSFKYSDRPMTKANSLPGKIEENEKQRRLTHLQAVQKTITLEKHQALIGQSREVLVEGFGRKAGQLSGRTRDLKLVNFDGPASLMGRLATVTILEAWPVSLIGQLSSDRPSAPQNLN